MKEEQAGTNTLNGKYLLFETDYNLGTYDIQFLEAAGNNEIAESLFQKINELELEDGEDDPDYNPTDPDSDLTNNGLSPSKERCD